jgi:hypothetical protein
MISLNFPVYEFHIIKRDDKEMIFDQLRKKYVVLTPEEWVRQHVIRYLVNEKHFPAGLIKIELEFRLYKTRKRFDIVVSDRQGKALILVECKAPSIALTQAVVDQAVRYNLALHVDFLMLSNGMHHLYCKIDHRQGILVLIDELPDFQAIF